MSNRGMSLSNRARRIRLGPHAIATEAGLPMNTVWRMLSGRSDSRSSTMDAIEQAIATEEQRLLRHLLDLHGVPAAEAGHEQPDHHQHQESADVPR